MAQRTSENVLADFAHQLRQPLSALEALTSYLDLITKSEAQFAAFMAVIIACLGFVVFRRLVDQIARLAREVNLPVLPDEQHRPEVDVGRIVTDGLDRFPACEGHAQRLFAIRLHTHARKPASQDGRAAQMLSMDDAVSR